MIPTSCPHCGRRTADNYAEKAPVGRHCWRDDAKKWAAKCGVITCACGHGHHNHTPTKAKP